MDHLVFISNTGMKSVRHRRPVTFRIRKPAGIAFDSYLKEIFVSNFHCETVSVISDATNKVTETITHTLRRA